MIKNGFHNSKTIWINISDQLHVNPFMIRIQNNLTLELLIGNIFNMIRLTYSI